MAYTVPNPAAGTHAPPSKRRVKCARGSLSKRKKMGKHFVRLCCPKGYWKKSTRTCAVSLRAASKEK